MTLGTTDLFFLDPTASDVMGDGALLRARGPLVPVELTGGVTAWATGHQDVAEWVMRSGSFRRDPSYWADYTSGKVRQDWPLLRLITIDSMLTMDGADHRALRSLVEAALAPARVERLRHRVEEIVQELIDDLAATGPDELVDLRARFAAPLPMRLICHLFGLDAVNSRVLAENYLALHDSAGTPERAVEASAAIGAVITDLIRRKRSRPADDLTSALIGAAEAQGTALDDRLLTETLVLVLFAGHEMTTNLLTNAHLALDAHADQLDLVRQGAATMAAVVEETLRWRSPVYTIMFYYAAEDVTVPGTGRTVRTGEAVVICPAATGRDERAFGPDAGTFDITRTVTRQHLSFGHGAHHCVGAPLARLTCATALEAFYERFDTDRSGLAAPMPIGSYTANSATELLTRLRPRDGRTTDSAGTRGHR
ncbi:cytochrome P450 [Streptomyces ruber]|uniref:Cytochrome P450 n=2 Tax=Streptomyces TaxID=1883 RepID=A0A918BCT6_9ACTN|nr:cytochrome P450 [Streptomyces ruber]GGQ52734.1 cytochrome P450 [Streptomyces ruber]